MRTPLRTGANPSLVVDVAAMIAENDRYRRPDAADEALWTRDGNYLGAECGSQAQYTSAFDKAFPGISEVLRRVNNVYVAGGAANWPLVHDVDDNCAPDDVDFFIVGIDPADTRGLWNTVDEIRSELMTMAPGDHWREEMTPGVLTMWCSGPGESDRKYQAILRAFATVSALLHGFDLASSAIAFDGEVAYMTHAAVWAHTFMLNVVNPAYRSTTYEYRLCKYLCRGYGLGFLGMSPAALPAQGRLDLPHMVIAVWETRDAVAFGSAFVQCEDMSDYSVGGIITADTMRDLYNIRQIAIGRKWYAARLAPDDFQTPGEFVPPTLDNILPRAALDAALDHAAKKAIDPDVLVSGKRLRRVFQMSDVEVHKFRRAIIAGGPGNAAASLLAPFRAALVAAYEAAPRGEISWWILIDPSRQYTVSLNPRMEDAAAWYGDAAASSSGCPPTARAPPQLFFGRSSGATPGDRTPFGPVKTEEGN